MKIIAFIFARGGSKGLPGKNIKLLSGDPLIAHSIMLALSMDEVNEVIVSTDDLEIAEVAMQYGASVPFIRPKELSGDNSAELLAWQHAVNWVLEKQGDFDIFVSLPATAPLRNIEDVRRCIAALSNDTDMVLTCKNAERSPYFNMVKKNKSGFVELINSDIDVTRRQDAPQVYDLTTVAYVTRPEFILHSESILDGNTKAIVIPKERAIDIDDKWDFAFAECIKKGVEYVKQ